MLSRPMLPAVLTAAFALACGRRAQPPALPAGTAVDTPAVPIETGGDATLASAEAAIDSGRPWEATRLLAPVLRDPARRTPEALLVAAWAAAGWEGWATVDTLLAGAPWLDRRYAGEGRVLLARAALARAPRTRTTDSLALAHAAAAVADGPAGRLRGERLVLVARAADRLGLADSARASYLGAAALLPDVSDWLRLRAAGVVPDSAGRAALYAGVQRPAARARIAWAEAAALDRQRDFARSAQAFAALAARGASLRESLLAAGADPAARATLRAPLLALAATGGPADSRAAAELLDRDFAPLAPAEQLVLARGVTAAGPLPRAAVGYAAAFAAGLGSDHDRFVYAGVLARLGRDRDAAAQYALVRAPSPDAPGAAFQRARALVHAGDPAGRTALDSVAEAFAADVEVAAGARFLEGDLAVDEHRDADARRIFRSLAAAYPRSARAADARLQAALIALAADSVGTAAAELDTLVLRHPESDERNAAAYWAGRAWDRLGKRDSAAARWRAVATRDPLSYYAMLAARRLGGTPWAPPQGGALPPVPSADSAAARARLLRAVGMDDEARLELEAVAPAGATADATALADALVLERSGELSRGIALAARAVERGAPRTDRAYRLIYPLPYASALREASRDAGIDPMLVAALTRQESNFTPRAASAAGARGVMQLLPGVAAQIARGRRFPTWDPVLLWQPDVNLELGTAHLASVLGRYPTAAYGLAAYNAGETRVARWRTRPGADDPELFTDRIPYAETRDYVRIILRSAELYRALY